MKIDKKRSLKNAVSFVYWWLVIGALNARGKTFGQAALEGFFGGMIAHAATLLLRGILRGLRLENDDGRRGS